MGVEEAFVAVVGTIIVVFAGWAILQALASSMPGFAGIALLLTIAIVIAGVAGLAKVFAN